MKTTVLLGHAEVRRDPHGLCSSRGSSGDKHIGMSLRVKQTDSRRALAPVLDECRAIGKPGLSPNG